MFLPAVCRLPPAPAICPCLLANPSGVRSSVGDNIPPLVESNSGDDRMRGAQLRNQPTNSRRARAALALVLAFGLLPLGHTTSAAQTAQATRIRFAHGAISAQVRGRL